MATVRITKDMTGRVMLTLRNKLLSTVPAFDVTAYIKENLDVSAVIDAITPTCGVMDTISKLPGEMRGSELALDLRYICEGDDPAEPVYIGEHIYTQRKVPQGFASYIAGWSKQNATPGVKITGTGYRAESVSLNIVKGGAFDDFIDEVVTKKTAVLQATKRNNEAIEVAERIMQSHTTLKAALRTWPALWDVLPDEYKLRHKEQTEPRRTATKRDCPALSEAETKALTARLMAAKITGGN